MPPRKRAEPARPTTVDSDTTPEPQPTANQIDAAFKAAEALTADPMDPPPVGVALMHVSREIGPVAKDRRVTTGPAKFNFRGIDDVLQAIHDSMARWGVSFIPTGFTMLDNTVGTTKSGGAQQHLLGTVHFRITGPRGDGFDAAVVAEAQDTSDKSASKLMSMAYKYLAFQVLSIPVEGALEESDSSSEERAVRAGQTPPPPGDAWQKYDEAVASVGMTREVATAKWRSENGDITQEEMEALPLERVFKHMRETVAYIRTHATQQGEAEAGQPAMPRTPEDTNANADGDAAATTQEGA